MAPSWAPAWWASWWASWSSRRRQQQQLEGAHHDAERWRWRARPVRERGPAAARWRRRWWRRRRRWRSGGARGERWTEAAERRGGGKDLTHELRACHRGERARPRGPGVGMCWDEACDYCDEKIYYDLYVEHQGWRRRNMVASFHGSGVGEEPRDIAIFVRFIVLCAVLRLSFDSTFVTSFARGPRRRRTSLRWPLQTSWRGREARSRSSNNNFIL